MKIARILCRTMFVPGVDRGRAGSESPAVSVPTIQRAKNGIVY